jgi:hypothetical protein
MTRRISLIIGIAVTALFVAVPTALGEGMLASSQEPNGVAYFYANERATLASSQSNAVVSRPDSHELVQSNGSLVSRPDSHETAQPFSYMDAAERADRIASAPGRDVVLLSGDDHVTFQPVDTTQPVATSGGRDLDWPQIGIGLGVGIALALGLMLALRATRQRPLAH